MRIISANTNGIRAAAKKGFFDWLKKVDADVVCIQETKAQFHQLSDAVFSPEGYYCEYHDAQKKGYSGVAIFSKQKPDRLTKGIGWEDFDFEKKTLIIRERKDPDPNEKSRKHSVIPLIDDAPDIIARQKKSTEPEKSDLIFPYNPRSVTAGWQRVRKELGIGDIRYHDLRRKGLSDLASRGVPLVLLAKISGHKSINILHNIYLNLDMENFDIDSFTPAFIKK